MLLERNQANHQSDTYLRQLLVGELKTAEDALAHFLPSVESEGPPARRRALKVVEHKSHATVAAFHNRSNHSHAATLSVVLHSLFPKWLRSFIS